MNQTSDTVADVLGDELMTRDAVEVSATDAGIPERPLLCVGILWKRDPLLLPRSYNITLKQLANKEKRLTRDPVCIAEYTYVTNKCKEKATWPRQRHKTVTKDGIYLTSQWSRWIDRQ